jgi:hypothetical protein
LRLSEGSQVSLSSFARAVLVAERANERPSWSIDGPDRTRAAEGHGDLGARKRIGDERGVLPAPAASFLHRKSVNPQFGV